MRSLLEERKWKRVYEALKWKLVKSPTKLFHEFVSGFSYLEEDTGFRFGLSINCKVGHMCMLLIFPS